MRWAWVPCGAGAWAGAAVHDVGQVVATASSLGPTGLSTAVVVKLCRVVLLAPLVAGLGAGHAGRRPAARCSAGAPPTRSGSVPPASGPASHGRVAARRATRAIVPGFVAGFLGAVALRSTGLVPEGALRASHTVEAALLCTAMVALGTGVRVARLRRLGIRPVVLGVVAWLVVAVLGLAVACIVARA